jgi:hypothetical protein
MKDRKRRRSMAEHVAWERELQASGALSGERLEESQRLCANAESASSEEIEAYDYFLAHLPEDETDLTSLVLRVQLLIEQRIREFIDERLLNPEPLEEARMTAHQAICLAEALTLPNPEPRWLWQMARRLNNIRNDLAHKLKPKGLEDKMTSFTRDYADHYQVPPDFLSCTAHMYSQFSELARLARRADFRIHGKPDPGRR